MPEIAGFRHGLLGKHLLGSVTINFTGNGGFNPKLDIRHFEDLVSRRNGG